MIEVVATFTVKEDSIDKFLELTKEMVAETVKEVGCISYALFRDNSDSNVFSFIESWENQETLDAHNVTEHFTRIIPQVRELCQGPADVRFYTPAFWS